MGAGLILEDVFQTGICEDPVDDIKNVAEPFGDSVDEEVEDELRLWMILWMKKLNVESLLLKIRILKILIMKLNNFEEVCF